MELLDVSISPMDKAFLKGTFRPVSNPTRYDESCREACDHLLRLEGKDPQVESQMQARRPGKKLKSTINALSRQVSNLKKNVRSHCPELPKSKTRHDDAPLLEPSQCVREIGTPNGNHSIAKMFRVSKDEDGVSKDKDEDACRFLGLSFQQLAAEEEA